MEHQPLRIFAEQAYLNYAMYVVLDRALAHIGDGLKPVQRRIIYAMSELGLKDQAKYKKSARTVGDVLGKFHPHGDSACYEAMVLMSQPFSYRYPLIDGQGNWGSIDDPKSFAAMRYTEARLSAYANNLLTEIAQGTVDWIPNFDGTLEEPALLPARLPNILLNGSTGIAVGMTTDIPPHNLSEVVDACIYLLHHPQADIKEIMHRIKGPDFPTGGEIITLPEEILSIYTQGYGSVRIRAVYIQEKKDIIITALPYQVSSSKILLQIAEQLQAKKISGIEDCIDESNHENPVRLVIKLRSISINSTALMDHLFATTDLEKAYKINFNMIGLNRKPQVKNILSILKEWLIYRCSIIKRRLQFQLDKISNRLHLLEGLLIAYLNIEKIIHIIRTEEEPKPVLMQIFNLSAIQAEAILEIKLRNLAKLEEYNIREEQTSLLQQYKEFSSILASENLLNKLIEKELLEDKKRYGDKRRSALIVRSQAKPLQEEIVDEPVTIILSQYGWVRAAKTHTIQLEKLHYKAGDRLKMLAYGRSYQLAVFLDSTGRSYSLKAHTLASVRSQGEPLTSRLTPPEGASFISVMMADPDQWVLLSTDAGYGFRIPYKELYSKNRQGKIIIKGLGEGHIMPPLLMNRSENQWLAIISNTGYMLLVPLEQIPILSQGKGNKILNISKKKYLKKEEYIVVIKVLESTDSLIIESGKRHYTLKPADWLHYQGNRGEKGKRLPRGLQKVDTLK